MNLKIVINISIIYEVIFRKIEKTVKVQIKLSKYLKMVSIRGQIVMKHRKQLRNEMKNHNRIIQFPPRIGGVFVGADPCVCPMNYHER